MNTGQPSSTPESLGSSGLDLRWGGPQADEGAGAPPEAYDELEQMPIGLSWRRGHSGHVAADVDPYTGETLAAFTLADASDVDEAFRVAERCQPAWAAVKPQERHNLMARAALIVEARKEEIVDWLIRESGSTRVKAVLEWEFVRRGLIEAGSYPLHVEGRILPSTLAGKENRVYRQPVGVVSVISPWNFPLHLSNRSVAPALAVGNAVVLKPASDTPITGGLLLARIFEEAGLPPGVFSVVIGAGKDVGDAFVDHPIPRVISFTGSTAVGRSIAERAGRTVRRVCLELGGNGPCLVFDDADLEMAVDAAVAGSYFHQGQICLAINRILVHDTVHDAFLDRFVERARALKVGNPAEADTAIGPIINRPQLDSIIAKVEATVARGARAVLRGQPSRLVLPPVVLADVTSDMPAAREEVFGPVASVLRFRDEEEAIRMANDTEYGLSSAVFTRDLERGTRVARRIDAGMTHINDWPVNDEPNVPFGGEKKSGLGRFGGEWALEEFTTVHWISVQATRRHFPI